MLLQHSVHMHKDGTSERKALSTKHKGKVVCVAAPSLSCWPVPKHLACHMRTRMRSEPRAYTADAKEHRILCISAATTPSGRAFLYHGAKSKMQKICSRSAGGELAACAAPDSDSTALAVGILASRLFPKEEGFRLFLVILEYEFVVKFVV